MIKRRQPDNKIAFIAPHAWILNKTFKNCNLILNYDIMMVIRGKKMKSRLVMAICLLTGIIIMSSFNLQLDPVDIKTIIPESMSANVLYICPVASSIWDPIAAGFSQFSRAFKILFSFCLIVVLFMWGWALYQNLLKDKFDGDKYKQPWAATKLMFWGVVIILMLTMTPNYFRTVRINGVNTNYVLCEAGEATATAVRADIVSH